MKITHMIFSLQVGGAESIMIDIMNLQVELGHELQLIIINDEVNNRLLGSINENVKIIRLGRQAGSKNIYHILKLYFMIYLTKIDIIHCHSMYLGTILQFYKRKKILTVHGIGQIISSLNNFDVIIAISTAVQVNLKAKGGFDSPVIYNGINTSLVTLGKRLKTKEFKLLQVGRLDHEVKGQDLLINAIAKILKNIKNINIKCYFIGEGHSYSYLKELVQELSLEKNIIFLGLKDREFVYENLYLYDLLVQPSRNEGFGLTIIEAMAAKVPVLVSDIEGPMEVILQGELGSYFKNEDIDSLSEKIINISQKENNKMEEAYKYTISNYDIRNTVNKYMKVYKSILVEGKNK